MYSQQFTIELDCGQGKPVNVHVFDRVHLLS